MHCSLGVLTDRFRYECLVAACWLGGPGLVVRHVERVRGSGRMVAAGAQHHKNDNRDPIQQTRQRFTAKGYAAGQGTDSSRTKTPDDHG